MDFPSPNGTIEVCCVLTGDWPGASKQARERCADLGVHYVQKIYEMLCKYQPLNTRWNFTCFTDRQEIPGISIKKIPPGMYSYFNKLWLFSPSCFPLRSRVLFFDLDTCIVGNWGPLATVPLEKPVMLRDLWAARPASGVMSWEVTLDTQRIWNDFESQSQRRPPYRNFHPKLELQIRTDEQWLYPYLEPNNWAVWQDLCPNQFASYKFDVTGAMRKDQTRGIPMTAERARMLRVVYFHGRPRPHEVVAKWNPFTQGIIP